MITCLDDLPAPAAARELLARRDARVGSLDAMRFLWRGGDRAPFMVGRHTRGIMGALTRGVNRLVAGQSSYMDVRCPVRHGKSFCVAYSLAWVMGKLYHMHPEIISVGATESLALFFSRMVQEIMAEPSYQVLFPGVRVNPRRSAAEDWSLVGWRGSYRAAGFGGSVMGRGARILVIDDWCPSREEAESQSFRDKVWTAFTNDLMMRRLDPCMVIVVSTPWHVDGLQGRIDAAMERDRDFPRFEMVKFPARWKGADGQWEYLFPEKFSLDYYRTAYAIATPYEAAGLLDCDAVAASGNAARRDWFKRVAGFEATGKQVRYWDTAATKKKTSDYTCGVRGGMAGANWGMMDIVKQRVAAGEVGDLMLATAQSDGFGVEVWIECEKGSMGLIGPAELAKPMMARGYTVKLAKRPSGSKLCVWMPMFQDAHRQAAVGGMAVVEGPCVEEFLKAIDAAPDTPHDDDLDAAAGSYRACNGLIESEDLMGGLVMRGW